MSFSFLTFSLYLRAERFYQLPNLCWRMAFATFFSADHTSVGVVTSAACSIYSGLRLLTNASTSVNQIESDSLPFQSSDAHTHE